MAKSILIADDEPVVAEIAKRKLAERGYEVNVVINGAMALEQLKKKIPDLILLDVQMPEMNGYTFLMERSKNPLWTGIPVVVLSAYTEMEPLLRRHGIKAYLLKPLKLAELLELVEKIIGPA